MKKIIKEALRRFSIHGKSSVQTPLTLHPKGKPRGVVLYSYICESLVSSQEDPLMGHSNRWESREIANIFLDMGFVVDAIDWDNSHYVNRDRKEYIAVFDINTNLQRLKPLVPHNAKMLLHITGSYPRFNNEGR